jgi:hypothetical protein
MPDQVLTPVAPGRAAATAGGRAVSQPNPYRHTCGRERDLAAKRRMGVP